MLPLLVACSGIAMACAPALQLRRILVRAYAADVHAGVFATVSVGTGLLALYGYDLGRAALALPNTLSALVNAAVVVSCLYFQRRDGGVGAESLSAEE